MRQGEREKILRHFQMPEAAAELTEFFFDEEDRQLILQGPEKLFTEAEYSRETLDRAYRRGILSKTDEQGDTYRLNHFYGFLDVFCVSRKARYDTLSPEQKRALDDWYFDAYYAGLDPAKEHPTPDRVIPLEDMLQEIDADPRSIYLNFCDCRSLTGTCGHSVRTCLTYKDGINTFADRGLSQRIDREQAKEIIRAADQEGLMHTTMGGGICNCCGDCCYLFRSQRRRASYGTWPASRYIAAFDTEKCIACGRCVSRCHLGVFSLELMKAGEKKNRKLRCDLTTCVGCGLCVSTCPTGALRLEERE